MPGLPMMPPWETNFLYTSCPLVITVLCFEPPWADFFLASLILLLGVPSKSLRSSLSFGLVIFYLLATKVCESRGRRSSLALNTLCMYLVGVRREIGCYVAAFL